MADVAFVALVVVAVVAYLSRTRGYVFASDDWVYAQRGHTFVDFFRPYNLSLNVVPIAVYRALVDVFGFHTTLPLRLVAGISEATVAVALYLTVRARIAPAAALVVGTTFLWYPNEAIYPSTFNHYLALAAVVACAAMVVRRRPSEDLLLALALSFALSCAPAGVAGAAGCLVYLALRREGRWRRWLAVGVPTAAWCVWWLALAHSPRDAAQRTFAQARALVVDGVIRSFDGLVANNRVLGGVLMALFAAWIVVAIAGGLRTSDERGWRTSLDGLRAADHQLAWSVALVAWWVGLAFSRGLVASPTVVRYQFVGSGFVVLAWLPSLRPARLSDRLQGAVPTVAALALAALVIAANNGGIADQSRPLTIDSNRLRANMVQVNLGASVVPDRARVGLGPGDNPTLPVSVYRRLVRAYGTPAGTIVTLGRADETILRLVPTPLRPAVAPPDARCLPLPDPLSLPRGATISLRAPAHPVEVRLRRLGPDWTSVGTIDAGRTVAVHLPGGPAPYPWLLSAPGACRVVPPGR